MFFVPFAVPIPFVFFVPFAVHFFSLIILPSPLVRVMTPEIESVATQIIDAAVKVHRALGPGLLESAYRQCLAYELGRRGLNVKSEEPVPLVYEGVKIVAYRADLLIQKCVIVENKTVDTLLPIHVAQLLTYLKLTGCELGFLINWKVVLIKEGIRRIILTKDKGAKDV